MVPTGAEQRIETDQNEDPDQPEWRSSDSDAGSDSKSSTWTTPTCMFRCASDCSTSTWHEAAAEQLSTVYDLIVSDRVIWFNLAPTAAGPLAYNDSGQRNHYFMPAPGWESVAT